MQIQAHQLDQDYQDRTGCQEKRQLSKLAKLTEIFIGATAYRAEPVM